VREAPAALALAAVLLLGPGRATGRPAGGLDVSRPGDEEYRRALDLVYDGAFSAAEGRLDALADAHPDDPAGP
jgi:hypothetical protein